MFTIHIRHIGPIVDTGEITITPLTLFIGKQSTGKSTLMKILCYCSWVEKHIMIDGEKLLTKYTHYGRFIKEMSAFHRFNDGYFSSRSEFHYKGSVVDIDFLPGKKNVRITKHSDFSENRHNEKICYIPSERNVATAIQHVEKSYKTSEYDSIFNYLLEYSEAKVGYTKVKPIALPFDHTMKFYHDSKNDMDKVMMEKIGMAVDPLYTSSGVQSALPLSVLADHVMNMVGKMAKSSINDITVAISKIFMDKHEDKEGEVNIKDIKPEDIQRVSSLLVYHSAKLFVEELEQNLFPESQFDMVCFLAKELKHVMDSSQSSESTIVMTTHSPYVLTTLNYLIKVSEAFDRATEEQRNHMNREIVLPNNSFSAYALKEDGTIENILDSEYHFISGDYLDALSDQLDEKESYLDNIIYGTDK